MPKVLVPEGHPSAQTSKACASDSNRDGNARRAGPRLPGPIRTSPASGGRLRNHAEAQPALRIRRSGFEISPGAQLHHLVSAGLSLCPDLAIFDKSLPAPRVMPGWAEVYERVGHAVHDALSDRKDGVERIWFLWVPEPG